MECLKVSLEHRKSAILQATINEYIQTAEPVGSKVLVDRLGRGISAATIRNELNDLEKEGFLSHLHTSSGRVPTDKGYRRYVDQMDIESMPAEQKEAIYRQLTSIGENVYQVITQATAILASVFDYTVMVLTPDVVRESLKAIHLVMVDIDQILVVMLHSLGVNREFVFTLNHQLDQSQLNQLSQLITRKLSGHDMQSVTPNIISDIMAELPDYQAILETLFSEIQRLHDTISPQRTLLTKGMANMLKLPEFRDVAYAQKVMAAIEENKAICAVLSESLSNQSSKVVIGEENKLENLKDCSIVLAPFVQQNQPVGVVGVLGPKRMAYPMIVPVVETITTMINHYLNPDDLSQGVTE